ncbi:MAG: c-type cytochrome [Gammaproteobacteria bacterium]|nr:c-type cytochrome [Gammaproteobacteria bacterium]
MSEHMNDRQFLKLFSSIIAGMIGLAFVFMIIAYFMSSDVRERMDAARQADTDKIVAARIQPVAALSASAEPIVEAIIPAANADASSGKATYEAACVVCHAAGVAGAPILGDASQWADRIAKGMETLQNNAINGFQGETGLMPAKGGNTSLSDDDVKAAVEYMVEESQ